MSRNTRVVLIVVAIVCFVLVALSAFTDGVTLNEHGWLAIGLASLAGASL